MCQKTPQKGTSTPKGRITGGNVTKARTSATTTKKRARLRLSPGGNGEGKKSPLRRLPTDHRESLTQTGLRLASRRGTVVVVVVGRGISESELPKRKPEQAGHYGLQEGKLLTFVSFRREECESFGVSASSPIDLAPFLGSFHCSLLTAHSPSHLTTHHSPLTTHSRCNNLPGSVHP